MFVVFVCVVCVCACFVGFVSMWNFFLWPFPPSLVLILSPCLLLVLLFYFLYLNCTGLSFPIPFVYGAVYLLETLSISVSLFM